MKNLCIAEPYTKDNEERVSFKKIGELFEGKNGKTYVKLHHIPGTLIHVLDPKPRQESGDQGVEEGVIF